MSLLRGGCDGTEAARIAGMGPCRMGAQTVFVARLPGLGLLDILERALADVFHHQAHLDDEEDRVEGMKPASVISRSATLRWLADMAVGSTPSTVQGWRPNSATNQPSSAAIQGVGMRDGGPERPAGKVHAL
jgi:hypothetical protein